MDTPEILFDLDFSAKFNAFFLNKKNNLLGDETRVNWLLKDMDLNLLVARKSQYSGT